MCWLEHCLPLYYLLSQIWCNLQQGLCHYDRNSNSIAHHCTCEEGLKIQSCHLHCKCFLVHHMQVSTSCRKYMFINMSANSKWVQRSTAHSLLYMHVCHNNWENIATSWTVRWTQRHICMVPTIKWTGWSMLPGRGSIHGPEGNQSCILHASHLASVPHLIMQTQLSTQQCTGNVSA